MGLTVEPLSTIVEGAPGEVLDALFPAALYDAATQRSLARLWTRMRTGQ